MTSDLDCDVVELVACAPAEAGTTPLREIRFRAGAWTPEEVDVLRSLFAGDAPIAAIADALDRPLEGVRDKIYTIGLRRNSTVPWNELQDEELVRRYRADATADIARDLGRACTSIYARAQLLGLSRPTEPDWTGWEDGQLAEGYRRAVPVGQIAALLGRTLIATRCRASTLALRHPNQPAEWTEAETDRALDLAETGARYLAIIEQLVAEGFPRRSKSGFGPKLRALGYGRGWGRSWTADEDALLTAAYVAGTSLAAVRDRLARTVCSLRWRADYLGLRGSHPVKNGFRGGPDWSEADLALLRAQYGKIPTKELAALLGRSKSAMFTRANVIGLPPAYSLPWTNDDRRALRLAYDHGIAIADLAAALGRGAATVSKYATKHDFDFGRRPRSRAPLTRPAILELGTPVQEKGEGRVERPEGRETIGGDDHATDNDPRGSMPVDHHQSDPPVRSTSLICPVEADV